MSHDRTVIRHAVEEIGFGFFTDEDIRKLSVKCITSPVTFDTLNNPLPGGLYDPALGPVDRHMVCETCGQDQKNCPGHIGHIDLAVSVYQPLLFGALYKLMRAKCFNCHNLRLSRSQTRVTAVKRVMKMKSYPCLTSRSTPEGKSLNGDRYLMMLVDAGRTQDALELEDTLLGYLRQDGFRDDVQMDDTPDANGLVSANGFKDRVLGNLEDELQGFPRARWCGGHNRTVRRQMVEAFIKDMGDCKKCQNCGALSPRIRKDEANKLFQVPLNEKARQANRAVNSDILSAVQSRDPGMSGNGGPGIDNEHDGDDSDPMEDDESEDDGEDVDGGSGGVGNIQTGINTGLVAASSDSTAAPKVEDKFMPTIEVELQMQLLWRKEFMALNLLFAYGQIEFLAQASRDVSGGVVNDEASQQTLQAAQEEGYRLFFIRAVAVPPPRFRPPMDMGDFVAEHPQNIYLQKVLGLNEKLKNAESLKGEDLSSVLTTWVELQTTVNCFIDSSKDPRGMKDVAPGLRQVLEKKEGLFRKHMMGKRVNYACRSVISPDPYLGTTEIGIPLRFAKELTYAQPVADWNVQAMRHLVEAGANEYPGANFVEDAQGRLLHLDRLSDLKRRGVAARLLSTPGQKVWRHLHDGDCMLVNRQPTLHKPGIMAHRVRVLRNPTYQTIRMHYANCNTYNADFDGDEINCHLPQNEVAKAEANLLAFTDEQYLVPTSGNPLRGLIQDHVDGGVKMCSKDCFFTRGEYQQLVYQALSGLPGLEIVPPSGRIFTLPPSIMKPVQRWSGKQVMSTILKHLTVGLPQLNLDGKARTPAVAFGASENEHLIIFREGELLQGVLDKGAFGASQYGLVHAVHELYGSTAAGQLLTALGRVLTIFLQSAGHTCGIEDLTLNMQAEHSRREMISQSQGIGQRAMQEMLNEQDGCEANTDTNGNSSLPEETVEDIRQRTATFLLGEGRDDRLAEIDRHMQSALAPVSSDIIKACLPDGQEKPFPQNCFSLMVLTGAKGSKVNHSQVSCALGQQALEGRRVPVMISGKSLPSFQAFEPSPRANGFITDRFLTGIRPQEYYFHCMAGREGLVDTAVKTSRSGYLQRCLVKHLEELKVGYDNTVRDGEGCVQQFLYGEDGVDTTQTKYLHSKQLDFLARNYHALRVKHSIKPSFESETGFDVSRAKTAHTEIESAKAKQAMCHSGPPVGATAGESSFVVGDIVFARRKRSLPGNGDGGVGSGGDRWEEAVLEKNWQCAEVLRVKHAGTTRAVYTLRFEDGVVVRKMPLKVMVSSSGGELEDSGSGSDSEDQAMRVLIKSIDDGGEHGIPDPVQSRLSVNKDLGCVSEAFQSSLRLFLDGDPASLREGFSTANAVGHFNGAGSGHVSPAAQRTAFELLMWVKYMRCLAAPGEAVGSIAAQSIGEPSTQMTLNTFHLAGHGGANVTLGIPRLREIIMTASRNLKTPSTSVPVRDGVTKQDAERLALRLSRLSLSQLLFNKGGIVVRERIVKGDTGLWERHYTITLKLFPIRSIVKAFDIDFKKVCRAVYTIFIPHLLAGIKADLRRTGEKLTAKNGVGAMMFSGKNASRGQDGGDATAADNVQESFAQKMATAKRVRKSDAEFESDDEDEDGQGTLTFGKKKEQASYGGMDEEEKAIWKAMSGKQTSELLDGDDQDEIEGDDEDDEGSVDMEAASEVDDLTLPASVRNSNAYKGVSNNRKRGEIEVAVKLASSNRRLLMVGLAEAAAAKTMVRSQKGIRGAYVVEKVMNGKNRVLIQVEGSSFETVWQLKEGGDGGVLDLNQLSSNDVWAMCQTYGVEAARASITSEITNVFGAYGIQVDQRHLGLVADHMTFNGSYRPLNRAGMADFSSPCLQMSFETTAEFMTKAAVSGSSDRLKSPSARIVVGRVGDYGTGMFELRQPT